MPTPQQMIRSLVDANFTQQKICTETGIPQPTLSRILSGKHSDPRTSTSEKLRTLYERSITDQIKADTPPS